MLTRRATEAEMIATFLLAELDSPRKRRRARIKDALAEHGVSDRIIWSPNTSNETENDARAGILAAYRGWGQWESVFGGLPDDVEWTWAELTHGDLEERIFTIIWYFQDNHGTRRLSELALLSNADDANTVAERLRSGESLASPILIAEPDLERLVILEGHNRLIGYARDVSAVDFPLRAMVGVSSRASEWSEW